MKSFARLNRSMKDGSKHFQWILEAKPSLIRISLDFGLFSFLFHQHLIDIFHLNKQRIKCVELIRARDQLRKSTMEQIIVSICIRSDCGQ